jgi:hypothetical protein
MSTIRSKLKDLVDALSELNDAPPPTKSLVSALENYLTVLKEAKRKHAEEEASRDLFAELVNVDEILARRRLDQLTDTDFKKFCAINRIKFVKGRKEKRVKGKAVKAKKAAKGKLAQAAMPEKREPDTIIPAQTERQATTEAILGQALQLKSHATT